MIWVLIPIKLQFITNTTLAFIWTLCEIPLSLLSCWTFDTLSKFVRPLIVSSFNSPKPTKGLDALTERKKTFHEDETFWHSFQTIRNRMKHALRGKFHPNTWSRAPDTHASTPISRSCPLCFCSILLPPALTLGVDQGHVVAEWRQRQRVPWCSAYKMLEEFEPSNPSVTEAWDRRIGEAAFVKRVCPSQG